MYWIAVAVGVFSHLLSARACLWVRERTKQDYGGTANKDVSTPAWNSRDPHRGGRTLEAEGLGEGRGACTPWPGYLGGRARDDWLAPSVRLRNYHYIVEWGCLLLLVSLGSARSLH